MGERNAVQQMLACMVKTVMAETGMPVCRIELGSRLWSRLSDELGVRFGAELCRMTFGGCEVVVQLCRGYGAGMRVVAG